MEKEWTCPECEAENYLCDCEKEKLQKENEELKEGIRQFICNAEPWDCGSIDGEDLMEFAISIGVGAKLPYNRAIHGDYIGDGIEEGDEIYWFGKED
ncbi:MAG: hypothetical protein GY861_03740 [bacterium]|nr:hypothetical protein [bacterium]